MGMVYRDMTPEEIAEAEKLQAEMPEPEPTPEEYAISFNALGDFIHTTNQHIPINELIISAVP